MPRVKIIDDKKVQELKAAGVSAQDLADMYKVTRHSIYRSLTRSKEPSQRVSKSDIDLVINKLKSRIPTTKRHKRTIEVEIMEQSLEILERIRREK